MVEEYTLLKEIQRLTQDFAIDEGQAGLPPEAFEKWVRTLDKCPEGRRERAAVELVAIAQRFHRLAPEGASAAILQLSLLVALLLRDPAAADTLVRESGLNDPKLATLLAAEVIATAPSVADRAAPSAASYLSSRIMAVGAKPRKKRK